MSSPTTTTAPEEVEGGYESYSRGRAIITSPAFWVTLVTAKALIFFPVLYASLVA